MSRYLHDSLSFGFMGLPVGVLIGYAAAKIEYRIRHHRRNR